MVDFIIKLINLIIKALGTVLGWVLGLLPPSPFELIDNTPVQDFLAGLSWIIPFTEIISILELWLTAIGLYYIASIVLRWVKAIN